jgi:CHAD domain-containing protein
MGYDSSTAIESTYLVRGDVSPDAITTSLQALVPTRHHAIVRRRMTLLDTFDGRVRRAGARLTRSEVNGTETIMWERRSTGANLILRLAEPVSFAWDLPGGPLHAAVAPVIGVRRLFAKADVEVWGSRLDILDDHSKTTARLRIESGTARLPKTRDAWRPLPSVITLTGLRGYEDIYNTLVPVIESRPGVEACAEAFDDVTLRELGALPSHIGVPGADLVPTVLAEIGARHIHHGLLRTLTANEPGVRASLDTEFLHDFRVAVRRTRSLLGQIKRVFPPDPLAHFSAEFSWLGRLTGPPRDMDVLVLSLRAQPADLPAGDIEALAAYLGQMQHREHHELIVALDGDRYRRLLSDWETFLERSAPFHPDAGNAGRLLADVVSERARRLSRRIARSSETIDENTPAERLHELRLAAKKLRYLIDVTPAFYDAADLERIVSALKKLQRVLGDFNDAQVQERRLLEFGGALAAESGPPDTVLALERLAEQCRQRGERLRLQVVDGLARFRAHDTRSACQRAFKHAPVEERVP